MRDIIRQDFVVGPGGVIEIRSPDLAAGSVAEVTVRLKTPKRHKSPSGSTSTTTSKDLGWPPGFFEQTFGSLKDSPLVRDPQGGYETRDEII